MLSISVIICSRNRWPTLAQNIPPLVEQLTSEDEIIIVDSSLPSQKSQETLSLLQNLTFKKLTIIESLPGLPRQRNVGIERASGNILLFLDDDVILCSGALAVLREFFVQESDFDAATGRLLENRPPNLLHKSILRVLNIFFGTSYFGKAGLTKTGLPVIPDGELELHHAKFMRGGFTAFRRNVFMTSLRFYEGFEGYAALEDTEFSHRFNIEFKCVYLPSFIGFHQHLSRNNSDYTSLRRQYLINFYSIYNLHQPSSKLSFWLSVIGIGIQNLISTLLSGNFSHTRGFLAGLMSISRETN